MAVFPDPPTQAAIRRLGPDVHQLPAGTEVWRLYFRGGSHPTTWDRMRHFGPAGARFDHHTHPKRVQTRGISYLAAGGQAGITCLAEVFQDTRIIDRFRNAPWLVAFELTRDVGLLDLTGRWPTAAGASMAINSGSRAKARKWSRAIYGAFPSIDGLYYCSSMNSNQPAIALYERALDSFPSAPSFNRALAAPGMLTVLSNAAHALNFGLL